MSAPRWRFAGTRTLAVGLGLVVARDDRAGPRRRTPGDLSGADHRGTGEPDRRRTVDAVRRQADLDAEAPQQGRGAAPPQEPAPPRPLHRPAGRRAGPRARRPRRARVSACRPRTRRGPTRGAHPRARGRRSRARGIIRGVGRASRSCPSAGAAVRRRTGRILAIRRQRERPTPPSTASRTRSPRLEDDVALLHAQTRRASAPRAGWSEGPAGPAVARARRSVASGTSRPGSGPRRDSSAGAEASLAAHILSMTRLAHLRAAKKTKGRAAPGLHHAGPWAALAGLPRRA